MKKNRTTAILGIALGAAMMAQPAVADDGQDDEHHVLDEVIVAATPLDRTVRELAQPTSVLSGDALARKQSASIGETLAGELGVNSSYFGPVASRPVIRGQFGERVRVLSNGLDSLDASALSEDHAVSVDSILSERVEIIRGPATLLYGSGAAGGLVNVVDSRIAEEPLDSSFSGAMSLSADTAIGEKSGAIKADFGTESTAFHLDWFRRTTEDIEVPGYVESRVLRALEEEEGGLAEEEAFGEVENTSSTAEGGAAAITLTGDDAYLGFSVSRYDNEYGIPGHHHEEAPGVPAEAEAAVRVALEQTRYDLRGAYTFDQVFDALNVRVARNDYGHTELEGDAVGTRFDTQGTDIRVELRHKPMGGFDGAIGVQYKNIDFVALGDEAFVPASDTSQTSLFAFEEYAVSDAWVLQASARIENQALKSPAQSSYDETAYGASIGSIWSFAGDFRLAFNLAHTERHPNATELFADGPHVAVQRWERGAAAQGLEYFDKELSTNLDVTLRGVTERLEWTLTAFVNSVDDYILLSPTAEIVDELQVYEFQQTDVEMSGFEAEALVDLMNADRGHLHARLFADYVRGEDKSGGNLPRLPPLRLGAGLHFTGDNTDASVEATYHDEQDELAENELPTDSFTLVSAEVSYTFPASDTLLFVRASNLTDQDARRHSSPLKDLVPLPGRSFHVGLRVSF
ncbi:MAG TPA: TonB-dependent receptor [Woeseiaceae bacterium]|nr:TonB-dependent receptor [Woeseiaceae bacterium]